MSPELCLDAPWAGPVLALTGAPSRLRLQHLMHLGRPLWLLSFVLPASLGLSFFFIMGAERVCECLESASNSVFQFLGSHVWVTPPRGWGLEFPSFVLRASPAFDTRAWNWIVGVCKTPDFLALPRCCRGISSAVWPSAAWGFHIHHVSPSSSHCSQWTQTITVGRLARPTSGLSWPCVQCRPLLSQPGGPV